MLTAEGKQSQVDTVYDSIGGIQVVSASWASNQVSVNFMCKFTLTLTYNKIDYNMVCNQYQYTVGADINPDITLYLRLPYVSFYLVHGTRSPLGLVYLTFYCHWMYNPYHRICPSYHTQSNPDTA